MRNVSGIVVATLCLILALPQAQAAKSAKVKSSKSTQLIKEKLVLMPLRLSEEDKNLQGAMETALVEGLQQKYEVFSGEQVAQKAREIFMKESRNTSHSECDETRCLQGIAESFQSELLGTANVTKQDGGYFVALSIRNLYDNKDVYSKSLPCENCTSFQVINKIKELLGTTTSVAEDNVPKVSSNDPDTVLWEEAQKGNTAEDYQVYLDAYPRGKFMPFARARIKRLKDAAQTATEQQELQLWNTAQQENSEASYSLYLKNYPSGRFSGFAKVRIDKLKNDTAASEDTALWLSVQNSGESKAVQSYLDKYPGGLYLVAAQQKLAALRKSESVLKPGNTFKDCESCPDMVVVPRGGFFMGYNDDKADQQPVHHVSIGRNFAMGKTEVTRGQFAAFVNETGYEAGNECWAWDAKTNGFRKFNGNWRNPDYPQDDGHPVACVNWNDVKAYTEWLSRKTGQQYRLPSEAEWDYAARGNSSTTHFWGDNADQACNYANVYDKTAQAQIPGGTAWAIHDCSDGYAYTAPAGNYKPNAFGLYDMLGNLFEWTEDSYHDTYNGAPTDGSVWAGDGAKRVVRGLSWVNSPKFTHAAYRDGQGPLYRINLYGFRVLRELP